MLDWKIHQLLTSKISIFRPFSRFAKSKLLILSEDNEIAQAQIYPLFHFRNAIRDRFGIELREFNIRRFLHTPTILDPSVELVFFQTWFDHTAAEIVNYIKTIKHSFPNANLVYLDWFAPTDLRYARVLNNHVSVYVKKHILIEKKEYSRSTLGDTNLTNYYGNRYKLWSLDKVFFPVPPNFFDKLFLGWNFALADYLMPEFEQNLTIESTDRFFDIHARFTTSGTKWYEKMRKEAKEAIGKSSNLSIIKEGYVSRRKFFDELQNSKLCFSPFGYGEVCWRDFEAIAKGCVLVKPDMSHICTSPNIYIKDETYVSIKWDYSDLVEKCEFYIREKSKRLEIAENAFSVVRDYLHTDQFLIEFEKLLKQACS